MTRRRLVALALVAALVLAAAACGVPTDGSPHNIADDDLPQTLRSDANTTTSTSVLTPRETVAVYWIRGAKLVRALHDVAAPASLAVTLDLLQQGPSALEKAAGDRSALSGADLILHANVSNTTAAIDLDPSFTETPQGDQILALGQLVLTATERRGISRVRFTVDGAGTQVPRADGTLTRAPVTAKDYRSLLAG